MRMRRYGVAIVVSLVLAGSARADVTDYLNGTWKVGNLTQRWSHVGRKFVTDDLSSGEHKVWTLQVGTDRVGASSKNVLTGQDQLWVIIFDGPNQAHGVFQVMPLPSMKLSGLELPFTASRIR